MQLRDIHDRATLTAYVNQGGQAEYEPEAKNPNLWTGLNLLVFALMEVRKRLINSSG